MTMSSFGALSLTSRSHSATRHWKLEQRLNQLMRQMAADTALRTLEGCQAKAR
jgi:hypothetical protein